MTTSNSRLRVSDDISKLVGETPMLQMKRLAPPGSADIFAKLEYLNPGGSVKDRAAIGLIEHAERTGKLKPGGTVIEATAGNTGIGLALIGVSRGYKVRLFVPEKFSEEKVIIMRALGADPANTDYHYETTAREIFEQMDGRVDAITVGCGTAGTFTGVARFLKERLANVHAVAVETQGSILGGGAPGPHKVEGIGNSFIPGNFDRSVCDEVMMVTDEQAFGMVKELAAREGVLGGSSSGANLYAAVEIAKRLGAGKRVVTLIPDSAERYLSKKIFEGGV